jgi:hypothetical protein
MAYIPRNFNPEQTARLGSLIADGTRVLSEVESLQEGMRDTVKAVAEELEIKPALLTKAIKAAYRRDFEKTDDENSLLEEILKATKNLESK